MNLAKMFETQKALDERIMEQHPELIGKNNLDWKILALLVELAECANEWRGFKKWSNDQKPRPKLLEEYVDYLHFHLSIGLHYSLSGMNLKHIHSNKEDTVERQFIMMNVLATEIFLTPQDNVLHDYRELTSYFIGLGEMLGFTWEEIEAAYFEKNKINHERQDTGY